MESLDTQTCFMDDLLDFSSDIGEEEEEDDEESEKSRNPRTHHRRRPSSSFSILPCRSTKQTPPFPEFVEEELEWISNKDAFPMVESFVDIIPNHHHPSIPTTTTTTTTTTNHQSPVSVLENSSSSSMNSGSHHSHGSSNTNSNAISSSMMMISLSTANFKVPGKARSKQRRKRRRDMLGQQWHCWAQEKAVKKAAKPPSNGGGSSSTTTTIGRKCLHCQAEKTPQWRAGPLGPKTLCNACGVRYKSGRLVPEYRPASSPTFSSELHSNSHRKIVEMRRQKMVGDTPMGLKGSEIG